MAADPTREDVRTWQSGMIQVSCRISMRDYRMLKLIATRRVTISKLMRRAIHMLLEDELTAMAEAKILAEQKIAELTSKGSPSQTSQATRSEQPPGSGVETRPGSTG